MAQVLKDSVREKILASASDEFLEKGYSEASMRSIAAKSGVTAGNLYRYFKSKDEINSVIVDATVCQLNAMLLDLTGGAVSFREGKVEEFSMDLSRFRSVLDELSERLVDIYSRNRIPFRILMLRSSLNDTITDWFASLIARIIGSNFDVSLPEESISTISLMYARSIFSGARSLLDGSSRPDAETVRLLKVYFRSFVSMLERNTAYFTEDLT